MSPIQCRADGLRLLSFFVCQKGEKMIITISRETGSGGHTIGKMLAEKLGYDFYDKEIISEVAREMNLSESLVMENGETMSDQTFMDMVSGFVPFSRKERVPYEEIKEAQDKMIKKMCFSCGSAGRQADGNHICHSDIYRHLAGGFCQCTGCFPRTGIYCQLYSGLHDGIL